jgi:hypothetical protein
MQVTYIKHYRKASLKANSTVNQHMHILVLHVHLFRCNEISQTKPDQTKPSKRGEKAKT